MASDFALTNLENFIPTSDLGVVQSAGGAEGICAKRPSFLLLGIRRR